MVLRLSLRCLFIYSFAIGFLTASQYSFFLMPAALANDVTAILTKSEYHTVSAKRSVIREKEHAQSVTVQPDSTQVTVSDTLLNYTQLGKWLQRFQPPQDGQPRSTSNGSSRDRRSCNAAEPVMQAQLSRNRYGLTLEERPAIFIDITETSANQALLIMRSENSGDQSYSQQAILPVPETKGITRFQLPEGSPALEIDQTYAWSLSFLCGDFSTPNDPTFTGWVRRMERTSESEQILNTASLEHQAYWLSENGYWYDLISTAVARLR